jgi:hypothetical protein
VSLSSFNPTRSSVTDRSSVTRPSWADVKRLVKAKGLFDEDDMQDPDFKAQLKAKAIELAVQVWLAFSVLRRRCNLSNNSLQIMSEEPEKDGPKATKKRKANSKQEAEQERPTKRVKQSAPKVNKKQVISGVESDIEMEAHSKIKVSGQKKPKQTIDDSEEDEKIPSRKAKHAKQREYSSAIDSDSGAVVPPKSPEVSVLPQSMLVTHTCLPTGDRKCSGRREAHTRCRRRRGNNCQRTVHELVLTCSQMSDSALSIVVDGTPAKVKRTKKEGKKTV